MQLQAKACDFIGKNGNWAPCALFYRDKDEEYYEYCQRRFNGFLPPVPKNENGDPASPVNGNIHGVYLGVNVDLRTCKLPAISPFGYKRFHVPIEYLYGTDFNLYFADFYCHSGSKSHHLSLVLTQLNSAADNFCKSHLPKLSRTRNPFLYEDPLTSQMMVTSSLWIEIFYTEKIPMGSGWFELVQCNSIGPKTGKPKHDSCEVCNIYHKQSWRFMPSPECCRCVIFSGRSFVVMLLHWVN